MKPLQSPLPLSRTLLSLLVPSDLALGDGPDPAEREVDDDGNDADDPKHLAVVLAVVAEDDGEDDAAKVTRSAGAAGDDSWAGC